MCYGMMEEKDTERCKTDDCLSSPNRKVTCTSNVVQCVRRREMGSNKRFLLHCSYGTRQLLQSGILKERELHLDGLNKVFCSQWLSKQQIVFGTKCNKMMVYNIVTGKMVQIPSLKSSGNSSPPENPCGMHSVEINPSRSLLATGGSYANDVAIYKLPTLDPVCIGEEAHRDWIFDIAWLDDEFFVSGSRDTTIALWRVRSSHHPAESSFPSYSNMHPLSVKVCKSAEKVRALQFNENFQELVVLSLNAYLHLWDAQTFKQKFSRKLPFCQENVCLAQQHDLKMYAVGSRSHITLLNSNTLQPVQKIPSKYLGCGIRSLSFSGDLLTIGTGVGVLLFYDVRAAKYLEQASGIHPAILKATRGWVYTDEIFREVFFTLEYNPAIYTHCYDSSGTMLFAAGGPLPAGLQGNYAGLWL